MFRGIGENVFRSRVAKRIFGLFILAAFIPIILISFISFNYISTQLDNEARRQLYRESRGVVLMNLYADIPVRGKAIGGQGGAAGRPQP